MNFFRFKQFQITDDRSAMKVGTDSVILGAWVTVHNAKSIIDIGCGSGLISLLLAQRSQNIDILGVEIDEGSAKDSIYNFHHAPWSNNLQFRHCDIRKFDSKKKYDLVISNPPFFTGSLLPKNNEREGARHDKSLSLNDLLRSTVRLMNKKGTLAIVFPYDREEELIQNAYEMGLFPHRILHTRNKPQAQIKRSFIEFQKVKVPIVEKELFSIRDEENKYSQEYKMLTKEFYLKF